MPAVRPHPLFSKIQAKLKSVRDGLSQSFNSNVHRCVELAWARSEYIVSGKGTRLSGSRWLCPQFNDAVYASFSEVIALKESRRSFAYYGIKKPRKKPRIIVEIHCSLQHVANLEKLESVLNWPSLDELLEEDWEKINGQGSETLGQAVGRALFELVFEGLIVRSAVDRRGRNLVWFPANIQSESTVEISGKIELDDWIRK